MNISQILQRIKDMSASVWNPGQPSANTPIPLVCSASQGAILAVTASVKEANVGGVSLLNIRANIQFGSAGTPANALSVFLTASNYTWKTNDVGLPVGDFIYTTAGGTRYVGAAFVGNVLLGQLFFVVNGSTGSFGSNPAITVANLDTLVLQATIPLA